MTTINKIKELTKKSTYYEDLYDIIWLLNKGRGVLESDYKNIRIGLFNTPCGGFGDIIVCKTFYDYLVDWYPGAKVSICTTAPKKYKELGISGNIYKLTNKDNNEEECIDYNKLILKKKIKFDIMIVIPIINKTFDIKQFKKLIPYANVFNTFSVSEYNGEYPPYTFPIGVGEGNLGLLFNNFKIKQQRLIKKPYALVYIQPSPQWGVHSKSCFLSYLEMICKGYSKKHFKFQVVIPSWIDEERENPLFLSKIRKVVSKYYDNIYFVNSDGKEAIVEDAESKSELTFRADILPQQRDIFISLMKDSIKDILVTGDQSLTDILSCCRGSKQVWYQIAPWKKGLAYNLSKYVPNKYYSTFKTSCGTLESMDSGINWKNIMRDYDFRINGKRRMDSIILGVNDLKRDKYLIKMLDIIEHSRYLETVQNKVNKLK